MQILVKLASHLIVKLEPKDKENYRTARQYRTITVRPMTESGLKKIKSWMKNLKLSEVLSEPCTSKKAEILQNMVLDQVNNFLPTKTKKIADDDKPWFTDHLKILDKKKKREFRKNRRSPKYYLLSKSFNKEVSKAKKAFKKSMITDTMSSSSHQWYSRFKRMTNFEQYKTEMPQVDEINQLSPKAQAERIAESFAKISNEYDPIDRSRIKISLIESNSYPKFSEQQIFDKLRRINIRKATAPGDIPPKVIKECSKYLSIPLCNIVNNSITNGNWPNIYKTEAITPIPKQYPTTEIEMLRPISILFTFDKIMESLIGELIIKDMSITSDPAQYGNRKKIGINHYLLEYMHKVLQGVDRNSNEEKHAVLSLFIDWKQAFSRLSHTLGVQSFIDNGVRASLIPILTSYFEERKMFVRWQVDHSELIHLPGSGAMGTTLGILEYTSQTNNIADCIQVED